jgi:iron complex transport system substrate-binding protein
LSFARSLTTLSVVVAGALVLAGCSAPADADDAPSADDYYPVTVTDMAGNEVTIESVDNVSVTDNRFFQIAADWDLPISVAPRQLMSPNNPLKDDEDILDSGNHREVDYETFVAADPDVIISGYRYGFEVGDGVREAAPDAAFVVMDGPEGQPVDEYVVESVTLLGEIFNKQSEAQQIVDEFEAALGAARDAYDPETTVMGLITAGGEINYSNPTDGRGASIFFDLLGLTPALETEGSQDHMGDSVSLEAFAQAQADVLFVLDRDAAVSEEGQQVIPALELITGSAALAGIPAVQNDAIYVMPGDYYLTEDVFAYIAVLDGLAELFASAE